VYRHSSDNEVTYTPEDMILFKESPFASWMERLTLENPGHGMSPDTEAKPEIECAITLHSVAFTLHVQSHIANSVTWDDFVSARESLPAEEVPARTTKSYTFHSKVGDVCVIDQHIDESQRRGRTNEAMRSGTKFIINGLLAVGSLSARVGLLIRSPGHSELGDYFYTPCFTQQNAAPHEMFRSCFAADLLHELQGKLPPQLLIMSDTEGLIFGQTEDHIHYLRAVKHRFITAQRTFRKHRMPDPMDSSHFGRWSNCANDLIKRRVMFQVKQRADAEFGKVGTQHSVSYQKAPQFDPQQGRAEGNKNLWERVTANE
jgi:hypothetical protein